MMHAAINAAFTTAMFWCLRRSGAAAIRALLTAFFALASTLAIAQSELIVNGGFETVGSGWTVTTDGLNRTDSWWNFNNPSGAQSGSRYVYLGAQQDATTTANNVDGTLYQTVTIPAGSTSATLTYFVRITTNETLSTPFDRLYVQVRSTGGSLLSTIATYSNVDASAYTSWTAKSASLTPFAGQTVRIAFRGTTDGSNKTVFRIDEVSLRATTASAVAPTVQTVGATAVASTSAQIRGSVTPNGSATSAYFEYGTTTGYGSTTTSENVGSGSTAIATSSSLTGLLPGTTYHYRAVATNAGGTSRGADNSFTTANAANAPFSLIFPLLNYTPYTAPVSSAFDHSMTARFATDDRFVTFLNEVATRIDTRESSARPYSFKRDDGGPFFAGVLNYVGTSTTGPTTVNYDGHPGYDYVVNGANVYAAAGGTIVNAVTADAGCPSNGDGPGKWVRIQDDNARYQTQYLHLSSVAVSVGQTVNPGDLIGVSGNTGCSTGAHLHFEVKRCMQTGACAATDWKSVDPYGWRGCAGCDPYTAAPSVDLWNSAADPEIASLVGASHAASWVYYQSDPTNQWYISQSSGQTYLLSGANGYGGELVWGQIANGNPVATVNYSTKLVSVSASASSQTPATSYAAITIAGGREITVASSRAREAARQLDGASFAHAWYFFQVQATGVWYIVNANGPETDVYRLRLNSTNSDYAWVKLSTASWTRQFSGNSSTMTIQLSNR